MIGREIDGRYRVMSKLGEGAMGEVYLVQHMGLGRHEALKVLHASLDESPDMVARFRREARATNRLQHPNIVCVYDFGQLPDSRFFITTEFAEGESLDVMLRKLGSFPVSRALHVLVQLADAVDHAHSRGVIHRDLKPANLILIERRGQVDVLKVLDFGIAKIIAPDYAETLVATKQGQVFGTPAYMAPEQVGGQGADPRIDLYAIGCIAHELLVGVPPFAGKTIEVMNAHLVKSPPRPSERRREAGIPRELDDIILRLLEKDPERRFPTGRDLADALRRVPGYADDKPGSGRRLRMSQPSFTQAMTAVMAVPEVPDDAESTGVGPPPSAIATAETLHGAVETEGLDSDSAHMLVEELLVQLAEALLDHGCNDARLRVAVTQVAIVRGALDGLLARIDGTERAADDAEQRGRELEARLSFAIGELRFDSERAGTASDPDLQFQLAQLERRHAEVITERIREVDRITDGAIALAAERAQREDELAGLFETVSHLVDVHAPRFGGVPAIRDLTHRLGRGRAVLRMAQRTLGG